MSITPRFTFVAVLLATTCLVPLNGFPVAQSEVTVLDEVVIEAEAGSKRKVAVTEVPQSVSVISREELDKQPGAKPITFTAAPTYKRNAPLRPSGLIGPVTLWTQ